MRQLHPVVVAPLSPSAVSSPSRGLRQSRGLSAAKPRIARLAGLPFLLVLLLSLTACDTTPTDQQTAIINAPSGSVPGSANESRGQSTAKPQPPEQTDSLTAAIQAQAAALADASQARRRESASLGGISPQSPPVANEVMWLDPQTATAPGNADESGGLSVPNASPAAANAMAASGSAAPASATTTEAHGSNPWTSPASRPDITSVLYQRIHDSEKSDLARALRAVSLTFADPDFQLDQKFLADLPSDQQDAVRFYHQLLTTTQAQMLDHAGRIDRAAFDAQLDKLFGQQPVTISHLTLCRRVMGFGVYEPFDSTTFLAGRDQKMIVYLELNHFQPIQRDGNRFSVDLQQELSLYSADGLAVWRNAPVKINDLSANRRRDFFVVQLITLPARLSVGQYRLKVRVTDLNGGSIDEQGLDLQLVADRSLVDSSSSKKSTESLPLRQP